MSKVQWEISNDEVTDRDTALRRLQEGTTGHVVCARDGACLQSYKEADGVYHCEIVFKTDSCCPPVFAAPEGVTGRELEMLYDRFANGDDFSFVENEWEPLMAVEYRHRHNVMWFIFLFIALVIAAWRHISTVGLSERGEAGCGRRRSRRTCKPQKMVCRF